MKLMKNMTTAAVILSLTGAQIAMASPPASVDQVMRNYQAAVDSGAESGATATRDLVKQLVDNHVGMTEISSWVRSHATPEKYQQFQRALGFAMAQAQGSALNDGEIQTVLTNAMSATEQEGVHWRSCGEKTAMEAILFAAAGTMGLISLSFYLLDRGQNGNMQSATQDNQTAKQNALDTYKNAAPNSLADAQKDQANISADQAKIAELQTEINNTDPSQTQEISTLDSELANTQSLLGNDQAAYTTDMGNYNYDVNTYTSAWLTQQDNQADDQMAQSISKDKSDQIHEASVARISAIVSGVLGAAGTAGAFMHCQQNLD